MKTYKLLIVCVVSILVIMGCATAPRYTDLPYERYDKNTEYAISDESDGFTVFVYHSLFQYFPNEGPVQETAKQNAMAIAYEYADENDREIQPLNEQRIKISVASNLFGITTASVSLRAFYK